MKEPHYQHDMMHCAQSKCKKSKKCYRYWLGQHAKGLVSMYRPLIYDECKYFLNIKDY